MRSTQNSLKIWRASVLLGHRAISEGHEIEAQKSLKSITAIFSLLSNNLFDKEHCCKLLLGVGKGNPDLRGFFFIRYFDLTESFAT